MHRKLKYKLSIIILLCSYICVYAQKLSAFETLLKVETHYKSLKEFDFEMEYKMYRGYTGNYISESYKGEIYKKEEVSQIKILGSEIIQFPDTQLTIINENKTLIYKKISEDVLQKSPMDVSTFLNFYKETNAQIKGHSIILEMVLKNTQVPIPYNKIAVYVNKDTFKIEKQVLYLTDKIPFVDENGNKTSDLGRMEISFKQKNTKSLKKAPKLNDYLVFDANNNVHLAKAYNAYTIINQTNL